MKWKEFYDLAVPDKIKDRESKKNFVVRLSRWVACHIAYLLHFINVTGNMVSFFRILMVFISMYLFSFLSQGNHLLAFLGVATMAMQMNLDGVDGALARTQQKASLFGERLDNFGMDYAQISFYIIIASMTGDKIMVLLSCLTAYIVVTFRQYVGIKLPDKVIKFFRRIFYTPISLVVVPLIVITFSLNGISIITLSYVVTLFYVFFASLFFIICSWIYLFNDNSDSLYSKEQ